MIKLLCLLIGAPLFLIGAVLHVMVRVKMKSSSDELDEIYYEFEVSQPDYARHSNWYKWSLWLVSASILLIFLGVAL